jgi:hypothetical protein
MPLWQFITIAALVGGLLILLGCLVIYARVLVNRIRSTNETLKRIEAALLATDRRSGHAPGTAAQVPESLEALDSYEVSQVLEGSHSPKASHSPEAPQSLETPQSPEAPQSPEVAVKDERVSYLTIRDLKVIARAGRPNTERAVAMSSESDEAMYVSEAPSEAPERSASSEAPQSSLEETVLVSGEPQGLPATSALSEDSLAVSPEGHEAMYASGELEGLPVTSALSESPLAASSESHEAVYASGELQTVPSGELQGSPEKDAASEDTKVEPPPQVSPANAAAERDLAAEKKKQNELMFLANQRRVRRARAGY